MPTEIEAREKWCPFVRVLQGANRDARNTRLNPPSCRCIASDCMAWRWNARDLGDSRACADMQTEVEPAERPAGVPPSWEFKPYPAFAQAHYAEPDDEVKARQTGYCGLAGEGC